LSQLGAHQIIDRQVLAGPPERPLESGRWAGAIDVVGGDTLASLLAAMAPGTSIAACGLAGGSQLNTTVLPFILRGVNLLGINAAQPPPEQRQKVWSRLTGNLSLDLLETITQVVPLKDVPAKSREILDGHIQGRVVVDVNS
jgi:acrylyl-CoA reductase (NADPH)